MCFCTLFFITWNYLLFLINGFASLQYSEALPPSRDYASISMALYRKRKAGASSSFCGRFPEFGAIFMCSTSTKEECLRRNLFGLPLSSASFVKAVRSGMILFLFEYERRMLYGVFEAVSDGQLNIVRHAYRSSSSSSKSFPAQVGVSLSLSLHSHSISNSNIILPNLFRSEFVSSGIVLLSLKMTSVMPLPIITTKSSSSILVCPDNRSIRPFFFSFTTALFW